MANPGGASSGSKGPEISEKDMENVNRVVDALSRPTETENPIVAPRI